MLDPSAESPDLAALAARLRRYAVHERRTVSGWLTVGALQIMTMLLELQWLWNLRGGIAEIGVYAGKTFFLFHRALRRGEVLVGIDPYSGFEEVLSQFQLDRARLGADGQECVLLQRRSQDVATAELTALLGGPARLVHVDGEHSAQAIACDLRLAAAIVSEDGVVIVDDFLHPRHPDVTEAVFAVLPTLAPHRTLVPFAVSGMGVPADRNRPAWVAGAPKLFLAAPAAAARYRDELGRQLAAAVTNTVSLAGGTALTFEFGADMDFRSHWPSQATRAPAAGLPGPGSLPKG